MNRGVGIFEEFEEEFVDISNSDNKKIIFIEANTALCNYINAQTPSFALATPDEGWGDEGFMGWFRGKKLYGSEELDGYNIVAETLYQKCSDCSSRQMYDESNSVYYCPICDNTKQRFKDKIFNVMG